MHQKNSSSGTKIKTHTLHKSNLSQIWFNKYPNPNAKPNQTHIDFTAYTHKSKFKCKTKSDPDENTHIQIDIRINKQNPQTKTKISKNPLVTYIIWSKCQRDHRNQSTPEILHLKNRILLIGFKWVPTFSVSGLFIFLFFFFYFFFGNSFCFCNYFNGFVFVFVTIFYSLGSKKTLTLTR